MHEGHGSLVIKGGGHLKKVGNLWYIMKKSVTMALYKIRSDVILFGQFFSFVLCSIESSDQL